MAREEIDRILTRHTGKTGVHLDVVKRELSEAGVVIKVKRELPTYWMGEEMPYRMRNMMIEADYVAVESLIEEE